MVYHSCYFIIRYESSSSRLEKKKENEETFDEDGECTDGEIERSASAYAGARDVGLSYVTRDMYMHMRTIKMRGVLKLSARCCFSSL